MSAFGSTAGTMLQYAAHAIESGQANVVVCVYADAPLTNGASISESAYGGQSASAPRASPGCASPTATTDPPTRCTRWPCGATCTSSGPTTTSSGRSRSASAQWALMNPRAQMRKPMTMDDYHASRWVVEPLHLFDCCLVSNGGVAVIVTSARARAGPAPAAGVPARLRAVRAGRHRRGPSASRRSTPAPPRPGSWRCGRRGSSSRTSTSSSSTTATPTPSSSPSRTTGSARRARAAPSSPTASSAPGARCRATRAAASSPRTTCGASRRCRRASSRRAARAASARSRKHDHVLVSGNGGALNFHSTTILSTHEGEARG